ncbi:MAG TPA: DUF1189 family protein [Acidobacteriota bacterium]|jgi:hypothetical protein
MNLIRQSYLSITDFEFYRSIVRQPLWRSVVYLLFWVTLSAVFTAAVFFMQVYHKMNETAEWVMQKLPPMEVKQGKLSAPVTEPLRLARQNPDLRIVVDPTDMVQKAEKGTGMEVIFNSNRIYFRYQGREDAYVFRKEDNFQVNRKNLQYAFRLLKLLSIPVGLVFFWPVNWVLKAFQLFFLVLGGLLVRSGPWKQLKWNHWLNIAIYALTPAILIGMIFEPTTVRVEISWLFYISTAMLYMLMAAQRCIAGKE